MPIDKRKMSTNHYTWLPSMGFSTNTIYLFLIFISLAWNAYNILIERQAKLENILAEILPSSSSFPSFNPTPTTSSIEQLFTKARHFIQQLTSKDVPNNSNSDTIITKPYTVRIVFLEMLIESLDTCVCIYTCGSCQGHTRLFQTCITN
jgi:hypothetical protein